MTSPNRRPVLVVALTVGALASAAALASGSGARAAESSTARISVDKACYVNTNSASGAPMTVSGTGFTPNSAVAISGGDVSTTATVTSDGEFVVATKAPILSTSGPGSMSATLTPAPVEYCQAALTSSMALPGGGWPTSGSAITTGVTHALFCFISSVGPGVSLGGNAPGSMTGGATASAAGGATRLADSNAIAPNAAAVARARISDT